MDTHRLKYFLRIAEEGSITRAAALTGIDRGADKGNSADSSLHVLRVRIVRVCGDFNVIFD